MVLRRCMNTPIKLYSLQLRGNNKITAVCSDPNVRKLTSERILKYSPPSMSPRYYPPQSKCQTPNEFAKTLHRFQPSKNNFIIQKQSFIQQMDSGRIRKLKLALALVTVAYVAHQAHNSLMEEENKEKRKQRMQSLKRKYESTRCSSSSEDEEYQTRPMFNFRKKFKTEQDSNEERPMSNENHNKEDLYISDVRSLNGVNASSDLVESFVAKFSESQFKEAFHVSRSTANRLHTQFKSSPEYKNIFKLSDQTRIPAKHYIWMFLWFVGRKCSYFELSEMFNVPLCKSVGVVETVIQFFNNCAREFIRFPETDEDLTASAESFKQIADFPAVIACLINTHIQPQVQAEDGKGPSTVQVFCNSKGRFLDVYVDSTNKIHPTEVLEKSQMNEKLKDFCQGRYHVLAKEDYFTREWLLTPFNEPTSTEQSLYNRKHSETFDKVSGTLEVLKKRFKQLTNMHCFSSYKIKKLIIACCVLHNICLEEDDCFESEDDPLKPRPIPREQENQMKEKPIDDDAHLRKIGVLKRKQILGELKIQ